MARQPPRPRPQPFTACLESPLRQAAPLLRWVRNEGCTGRALLAAAAGTALALAFPLPGWAGLAWVAPGLLLLATAGTRGGRAFRLGYLAGLCHNLVALRWLLHIPFPAGAGAGWLALSAYLALYPALWVWLCWRLLPHHELPPASPAPVPLDDLPRWLVPLQPVAVLPWISRLLWGLLCAATWVTTDMIADHLFSGFPWKPLGVSQHQLTPLLQIASVTGVPGVSFLVVWSSVALFLASVRLAFRVASPSSPGFPSSPTRAVLPSALPPSAGGPLASLRLPMFADLGLPLLAVFTVTFWGARQLVSPVDHPRELRLALVQPSIPQRLLWDDREATNRFRQLLDLSSLALAAQPHLLVWPEASLPNLGDAEYRALIDLIANHHVWMILGADDAERRPEGGFDSYNSAFLFDPTGQYLTTYRKQRLVIFGEYIPLERWLPFLKHFTPIEGSFTSGPGPVPFVLTNPPVNLSVLICFEDVFARGTRHHVTPETDLLLNLTNNGWFGESAAQYQHAANAVFRAIENGLPLVRCCNNGLTCWIDERGRLRQALGGPDGNIYAPGFLSVRLPLGPPDARRPATFYRRHGDVFGWTCVAVVALGLVARLRLHRRT